jgi:hypothetical protein
LGAPHETEQQSGGGNLGHNPVPENRSREQGQRVAPGRHPFDGFLAGEQDYLPPQELGERDEPGSTAQLGQGEAPQCEQCQRGDDGRDPRQPGVSVDVGNPVCMEVAAVDAVRKGVSGQSPGDCDQ